MKKLVLTSCSIVIALEGAISVLGAAENSTPNADSARPHHFRHQRMMQALDTVGATDAQKQQIRSIVQESRPAMQPLRQQLMQERKALRDVMQTSPVNEPAIRAQSARVAQIQADLAVQRAQMGDRIRAVLTPDQVGKLKDLRAQRQAQREAHRQEWLNQKQQQAQPSPSGT